MVREAKLKKGDLAEIVWDDASGIETDELEAFTHKEGLVRTTSYGMIKYIGMYGIQIIHEHAENDSGQVTTIPKGWEVRTRKLNYVAPNG